MIAASDEEIKFWYEHCENQSRGNMTIINYSYKNKLDTKLFGNWKQRFNPWHGKYKELEKKERDLALLYKATSPPRNYFCNKHGFAVHRLGIILAHLGYMERLKVIYGAEQVDPEPTPKIDIVVPEEEYMDIPEQERKPMQFMTRSSEEPQPLITHHAPEAEVMEERNNIELTITKGVKVILSPEFPSIKIIKIIELLKDL